jgi:outer membrane protein assembly factor BamB
MDPPDVKYDEQNIRWMTPLPARSTSTPILVGDRLFVLAEPDELLCLDKMTGKTLWSAAINYYEALTPEEKRAQPAYAERVDPLVAKLRTETDPEKRLALRAEIRKALLAIDAAKFRIRADGHFEAHFGIVGFTMPTPVSDGTHIYIWNGMGVAACFDLAGKREWITRVEVGELTYGSSPALVDGVLVVYLNGLYGLDAKTGKQLWQQKRVRNNVASLLGATVGGKPVVISQRGDLIQPSNGEILFRPPGSAQPGDVGWAPPVIIGDRLYQPKHGVTNLGIWDLSAAKPDNWEPRLLSTIQLPESVSRGEGGKWIDRSTPASPLLHDGLAYQIDIYQILYVVDLSTGKMIYRQEVPLDGLTHYNAVAVAASPTLVGKHILVCDNQGTTLVIDPGRSYREVAKNKIATVLDRRWPIPAQETLTYAPPLADGDRLYLRGERYLYCIGEK